ncbi:hypothetical protein ZWY2020_012721 [Hordeum vulgare]|nr:hypothetical protein ZWY2020_012721 [Hordeum vulgare]
MVGVHWLHPPPRLERTDAPTPTPCRRSALHEGLRVAPSATQHRLANCRTQPPCAATRSSRARSARPLHASGELLLLHTPDPTDGTPAELHATPVHTHNRRCTTQIGPAMPPPMPRVAPYTSATPLRT